MEYGIPQNERARVMIIKGSFEASYPHFAFAPLVRFGIAIAAFISGSNPVAAISGDTGSAVGGALGSAA